MESTLTQLPIEWPLLGNDPFRNDSFRKEPVSQGVCQVPDRVVNCARHVR